VPFGPIKIQYVLLYTIVGAWMPYLPVYLDELGMTDGQIGWIIGVYGLSVLIMPAAIAFIADRHVPNRTLMAWSYLLSAVLLAGMAMVTGFWPLLAMSMLFSLAYTPLFTLTDGITFAAMHDMEERGGRVPPYHRLRIWGSVGFIVPSVALFFLLRYTEMSSRVAIVTAGVAAAVALGTTMLLPVTKRVSEEGEPKVPTLQAWHAIRRRPVTDLVGPAFLMFVAISIFYVFYTIHLSRLGVADEWLGLIVNIGVVAEVVLMLLSGRILRAVGVKGVMVAGAAALVVRLSLLATVPTQWVAIGSQVLHAPIVLALYLVPPMYLNTKASRSYRNSMQGVYGALCFGFARMLGSVVGGYAAGDKTTGLATAFGVGAVLAAVALVWLIAAFRDDGATDEIKRRTVILPPAQPPEGEI
jgi:PPP family 3-phenylpropionic acid transporter